jgi:hypothetical protein
VSTRDAVVSFIAGHKVPISLIGVVFIILGWIVDRSEPGSWADRFIFRSYSRAMDGLTELRTGKALTPGTRGFDEIAAVVRRYVTGPSGFKIAKIEAPEVTSGVTFGERRAETGTIWRLRVTVGSASVDGSITNFDDVVQKEYRGHAKDRWSAVIFWFGVLIQIVLAFM